MVILLIISACAAPESAPGAARSGTPTTPTPQLGGPCGPDADVGVEFGSTETAEGTVFAIYLVSDQPGCLARTRGWIEIEPEPTEGLNRIGLPFFAAHDAPTGSRGGERRTSEAIATWILVNWCVDPISLLAAQEEVMAATTFDSTCNDPTQPAMLTRR